MLASMLASGRVLLADGATGTNLFERGLTSGDSPELWNDIHPDRITQLHHEFVAAGADIILTNSFGANRRRLMLHQLEERTRELNRLAVRNARAATVGAGRPVIVAGSVGPTGDLLAPLGPLTEGEAVTVFVEQIEGLKEGGADVVWIETMSAIEEIRAAARAAAICAMPYAVTASFDTAGRTMMGILPGRLIEFATALDPAPLAVGANCGVGATDLVASVLALSAAVPDAVVIAKANCGIPQIKGGSVVYSGSPKLMADYVQLALDAGVRIVGGCCGTSAVHLAAMRRALDSYVPGPRPDRATIEQKLGALVAPPRDAATAGEPRVRRRARG